MPHSERRCGIFFAAKEAKVSLAAHPVQFGYLGRPQGFVYRFEYERDTVEMAVAGYVPKTLPPYFALTEVGVAVDAAAQRAHGVVKVYAAQILQRNDTVQLREGLFALFGGTQVVTCGEGVAGVYAVTHPRLVFHTVYNIGQLFELESDVGALPCGIFDYRRNALGLIEGYVYALGHPVEAFVERNLFQVTSRMEIQSVESEELAAAHLVDKRRPRLRQPFGRRMSEVYEVGIVRQNYGGGVTLSLALGAESFRFGCRKRRREPLALVLCEKRKGACAYGLGVERSVLQSARSTYVCSEVFHTVFAVSNGYCEQIYLFLTQKRYLCVSNKKGLSEIVMKTALRIIAIAFTVAAFAPRAYGQYTIQRRQDSASEKDKPPYEAFGGFVSPSVLRNDYFDRAAWLAERRRIRKERNTLEFQATFQTSALQFDNWTAGGNNTVTGLATIYAGHTYKLNKFSSTFTLNSRYGINYIDKLAFKNIDEFRIKEIMSWTIRNSWSYSAEVNFRTQMADGFKSRTDHTLKSAFMSPGYLDLSIGFTFSPDNAPYKITLSPLSGNMITMLDNRLYKLGLNGVPAGDKVLNQIGPSINISYDDTFFKKLLRYRSTFYTFSNLTSMPTVRWDNTLDMSVGKAVSVTLYGVLYYLKSASPKPQYQYSATIGLSYKFKNK